MAAGALIENELLVSALVAELGVNRYGLMTFRAFKFLLIFFFSGLRQPARKILGEHGRHH